MLMFLRKKCNTLYRSVMGDLVHERRQVRVIVLEIEEVLRFLVLLEPHAGVAVRGDAVHARPVDDVGRRPLLLSLRLVRGVLLQNGGGLFSLFVVIVAVSLFHEEVYEGLRLAVLHGIFEHFIDGVVPVVLKT